MRGHQSLYVKVLSKVLHVEGGLSNYILFKEIPYKSVDKLCFTYQLCGRGGCLDSDNDE